MRKDGKCLKKCQSVIVSEGELGSTVRQRESWVSTRAVFSPGNWAGPLLSLPLSLSVFRTLAHPLAPPPLLYLSLPLQIWAIACYFLLSALPLCSLCHKPAPSEHWTGKETTSSEKGDWGLHCSLELSSSTIFSLVLIGYILLIHLMKVPGPLKPSLECVNSIRLKDVVLKCRLDLSFQGAH